MSDFLNNDQINFYKDNGYLVVDDILSEAECDKIIKKMERHANKDYAAILNPDRLEFLIAQSAENLENVNELPDKVNYIGNCQETSIIFNDYFLKNPKSVGILETLYNAEMSGLMTQIIFKKAGSPYAPQAWTPHQDNSYVKNEKGLYVTTNFFFKKQMKKMEHCTYILVLINMAYLMQKTDQVIENLKVTILVAQYLMKY